VIWLAWRQQRTEALIAALLLVLVAALVVPTGLHMASVYEQEGIAACLAESSDSCREKLDAFVSRWGSLWNLAGWFNLVPALLGALVAAPFVLEFERGTFRLAWTQSVTRTRWLATRLALIAAAAATASLLLTLLLTWWRGTLDDVDGRMVDAFSLEGVAPIAYTLFAAALVVALGVVLRRSAAAIGLALVVFFVVRIAVENWARPKYAAALEESWIIGAEPDLRTAWVFREANELRVAGGGMPDPAVVQSCLTPGKSFDAACLAEHDLVGYTHAVYHPASRFWLFQGIEAGIFTALTVALIGFSVWWIRKRIS
jgi:ABC-2 family transporter protein